MGRRGADPGRRRRPGPRCSSTRSAPPSPPARSAWRRRCWRPCNPYLIWHDVHLNREVLDGLLAALLTLLVVLTIQRRSLRIAGARRCGRRSRDPRQRSARSCSRLRSPPISSGPSTPRRLGVLAGAALVVASAIAVAPWVVRNDVSVGCATMTTDARALWKANNPATFEILRHGGWIDQVPELPGAPPWPELAADLTLSGQADDGLTSARRCGSIAARCCTSGGRSRARS